MEKFSSITIVVLTGLVTAFLSAMFYLGTQEIYLELLKTPIKSFCQRWVSGSFAGVLIFLACIFAQWLFVKLFFQSNFEDKLQIISIGVITQFVGSFIGTAIFFSH